MDREVRRAKVLGVISIGAGIIAAAAFAAALVVVGVHVWASVRPVTEDDIAGTWAPEGDGTEFLELHADGRAVAVDVQYRGTKEVSGAGTWTLVDESVLLAIDDGVNIVGAQFEAEPSGFTLSLVDYIGDPDEGRSRLLVRDER